MSFPQSNEDPDKTGEWEKFKNTHGTPPDGPPLRSSRQLPVVIGLLVVLVVVILVVVTVRAIS
jgi:hypothetical protein